MERILLLFLFYRWLNKCTERSGGLSKVEWLVCQLLSNGRSAPNRPSVLCSVVRRPSLCKARVYSATWILRSLCEAAGTHALSSATRVVACPLFFPHKHLSPWKKQSLPLTRRAWMSTRATGYKRHQPVQSQEEGTPAPLLRAGTKRVCGEGRIARDHCWWLSKVWICGAPHERMLIVHLWF